MNISYVIIFLGAIVFLSHFFTHFFDRIKVPNVLLLMIIGILIGPVFGVVKMTDFGKVGPVFSNLVLLLILFESGANLKLKELGKSLLGASILTILAFVSTLAIVSTICHTFLGLDWLSSAMIGAILGGTSSAIVIPMIGQLKIHEKSSSLLLTESALSDVLCLISGLSLFVAMKTGEFEIKSIIGNIGVNFLLSIVFGILSGLIWSFIIGRIRKIRNSILATGAYLFIVYGTIESIGYNGGIAALMLGLVLGNVSTFTPFFSRFLKFYPEPINNTEKLFYGELVFVAASYYFVYIGVSIQFGTPVTYLLATLIMIVIFLARMLIVKLIIRKSETKPDRNIISSISPKGLVPAILASLPLQAGFADGEKIQNITFAVILVSIVFSSTLVILQQRKMNTTHPEVSIEPNNPAGEKSDKEDQKR